MQPTDNKSHSSLVRDQPITRPTRVEREYHFEWQPQSSLGGLVAVLLILLLLVSAFMFSLMLMAGVALLILVSTAIAYWKRNKQGRSRKS